MKKYRVDMFVHDEFFGDENGLSHIKQYFDTLPECHLFITGWLNIAKSIFILENIIDDKFDIIEQIV